MAFQCKQLVPCLCTILLLSIMSFSHTKAEPCKCADPQQDQGRRSNHTLDDAGTDFYLMHTKTGILQEVGVDFLRSLSDADAINTGGLSIVGQRVELFQLRHHPRIIGAEASFSVRLVYEYQPLQNQNRSAITFLVLPVEDLKSLDEHEVNRTFAMQGAGAIELDKEYSASEYFHGHTISVAFGFPLQSVGGQLIGSDIIAVVINIDGPVSTTVSTYVVWVDYDRVVHRLLVYVDKKGVPKPEKTIIEVQLNITDWGDWYSIIPDANFFAFGVFSTVAQLLRGGLNATVEDLPDYHHAFNGDFQQVSGKGNVVTILSSVLGSMAATIVMATAIACYFNSRYRRWHKDLDQLARSMERLPGVPTKIDFADIKKATGNFHDTMKLGGGGFGTVYRCTLPAAASKMERPMDVAVKRFTRDVQNRCYDDFLAEVSIINRLRHKNIVPLIGWAYNKGEPLLVFEFMTNGSLDQHLFRKSSTGAGQRREQQTSIAIRQWATRYEIVRDIATGLHYVHHEYEPMVLHRDIKASNMMLDSSFRARLGDFGLACTVAVDRNSATGVAGTWGYIAPEYAMCGKATRQTDIFALGVLILEIVTGQRALIHRAVDDDDVHITDRVWRLHREGKLLESVDTVVLVPSSEDEEQLGLDISNDAERLLLLGLACSNPNPSDRPAMPDVVQVIAKSAPPPEVPLMKPMFMWPPPEWAASVDDYSLSTSMMSSNLDRSTAGLQAHASLVRPAEADHARSGGGHASLPREHSVYVTATSAFFPDEIPPA